MVLLFYEKDNALSCAIYKHSIWGYKLLRTSGSIAKPNENGYGNVDDVDNERHLISSINRGDYGVLFWGLLYDDSIVDVSVEGNPVTVVSKDGLKFWFGIFDSQTNIHSVEFIRL